MNQNNRLLLLEVARQAIEAAVSGKTSAVPQTTEPELLAHCGCFVTLKRHGDLRGCIGNFISNRPLIELVHDMAIASATDDPRFYHTPITPKDARKLEIEISVLSELKRTSDPMSVRLGVDGIYIKRGFAAGCFLPQVATETGWTAEEFLSYCCEHKAGLSGDAWKDPKTEVYFFTAEVFGE